MEIHPDAHYVLATPDKRPFTPRWRDWRPSDQEVEFHVSSRQQPLGCVPWSLGCAVVDIDRDASEAMGLIQEVLGTPVARVQSLHGGWHLWYRQSERFTRRTFEFGDLICDHSYVVVTDPSVLFFEGGEPVDVRALCPEPKPCGSVGPTDMVVEVPDNPDWVTPEMLAAAESGDLELLLELV